MDAHGACVARQDRAFDLWRLTHAARLRVLKGGLAAERLVVTQNLSGEALAIRAERHPTSMTLPSLER